MKSAVLFLVFNRPDTTRQVFEAIRSARPPRLYVAADGPRDDRIGEVERCAEVRSIATNIDWPCEVKTLFRDKNLGCKIGVSGGISWFFEQEEEGIILEDDVLPISSFFPYCDELLERYRNNEQVGLISGCNLISKHFTPPDSYFFSHYNHIWGWASWRRAWQHYDVTMQDWPQWRNNGGLKSFSHGSWLFESYWSDIFDSVYQGKIDTWDYQWTFTCWKHGLLSVLPTHNQTYNLGFGPDATHTTEGTPEYVIESIPTPLKIPLKHPDNIKTNINTEQLIDKKIFSINLLSTLKNKIRNIPLAHKTWKRIRSWTAQ